jgi:hypothetical protein
MSRGLVIQSIEFLDDNIITFTWAYEEDVARFHGEVRKAWVDLTKLPEHVAEGLLSAVDDLIDEYHVYKRSAPGSIEAT